MAGRSLLLLALLILALTSLCLLLRLLVRLLSADRTSWLSRCLWTNRCDRLLGVNRLRLGRLWAECRLNPLKKVPAALQTTVRLCLGLWLSLCIRFPLMSDVTMLLEPMFWTFPIILCAMGRRHVTMVSALSVVRDSPRAL